MPETQVTRGCKDPGVADDTTGPEPPGPSTGDIPDLTAVQPKLEQLLELAEEVLDGRCSVRINLWEDGEVEIRVWHAHGYPDSDVRHRTVLRYHSRDGDVTGAVFETSGDERALLHKETLANLGMMGAPSKR